MKDGLLFACAIFILFGIGFWLIPRMLEFLIKLYNTNSLFDFCIFVALMFAIWCLGNGDEK